MIPTVGKKEVMDMFHEGHPGASRMKSLACTHARWPGMDSNLVRHFGDCDPCQRNRNNPPQSPLLLWEFP